MNIIEQLEQEEITRLGKILPEFAPGDTVIVNVNVVEGERKDTESSVERLMGNKPEARFEFIQERAEFADDEMLDV